MLNVYDIKNNPKAFLVEKVFSDFLWVKNEKGQKEKSPKIYSIDNFAVVMRREMYF